MEVKAPKAPPEVDMTPVYTVQGKVSSRAELALKARQSQNYQRSKSKQTINETVAEALEEWAALQPTPA